MIKMGRCRQLVLQSSNSINATDGEAYASLFASGNKTTKLDTRI